MGIKCMFIYVCVFGHLYIICLLLNYDYNKWSLCFNYTNIVYGADNDTTHWGQKDTGWAHG